MTSGEYAANVVGGFAILAAALVLVLGLFLLAVFVLPLAWLRVIR